jgi:hypothetical protein
MNYERYYELEFAGVRENFMMTMEMAEMAEEGCHYIGVTLEDHETVRA